MNYRRIGFYQHEIAEGGTTKVLFDTMEFLSQYGCEFHLLTTKYCRERFAPSNESSTHTVHEFSNSEENPSLGNYNAIVKYAKERELDLLIMNAVFLPIYSELHTECPKCKLVYWMHSSPFHEVKLILSDRKRKKNNSVVKWFKWYASTLPKHVLLNYYYKKHYRIEKHKLQSCDYYFVLTREFKQELIRTLHLTHDDSKKIFPIYNVQHPNPLLTRNKEKEVIFVGRLTFEKRVELLLNAWKIAEKLLPDWELKVYGDGEERCYSEALAKKLKLRSCRFMGLSLEVERIMSTAAICCLTSLIEGYPCVLLEAQANGVVPISFDCGAGVRNILSSQNGSAGILIPQDDVRQFAKELIHVCTDESFRDTLQDACIKKSHVYTQEVNRSSWEGILELTGKYNG